MTKRWNSVIATVRCTERVPLGFFAIDVGSVWNVEGVKYNDDLKKSVVHISEKGYENVWAEIPQKLLANNFELE